MPTDNATVINQLKAEIKRLKAELAGKKAVIDTLYSDLNYYRKNLRDTMIYDQGLPEEPKQ